MSTINNPQQMVPVAASPPVLGTGGPVAAAGGDEAGGPSITARDVWRVIKQRKVMITVIFVVLYLLVGVATYLIYRYAPLYSNGAYIELVPGTSAMSIVENRVLPRDYIERLLSTEANQIKSPQVLLDVLSVPEVKETGFYKWYGDDFEKCLDDFERMLSVAPVRDTNLIRVAIAVRDARDAKTIVNTVVNRYVAQSRSDVQDEGLRRLETLKQSRDNVERQLANVRQRVSDLRSERDMPAIESEREVLNESIAVLTNTRSELLAREADLEAQLATIRGTDYRNLPITAEMRVIVESDPVLRYYRQQVESLEIQIEVAEENLVGPKHPYMKVLKSQRDAYFQMEAARREELIDDLRARQVESLQQEIARVRTLMTEVQEQLTDQENTQRDLDSTVQEFNNLETDEERLDNELQDVNLKLRDAETQLEVRNKEGRLIAIPAVKDPVSPSRPQFVVYLGGGLVLSLLVALGLALLREFTDQAIRTPIDVTRHARVSVLGSVPLLDDEEADIDEIEDATRKAPHSLVAEAFRQIRAHLTFSGPIESQQVLLITSPRPEDGKTATAVNLAVTFAQGNQRVLLIDGNFRRPGIRPLFRNARPEGLSNVLVGRNKLEDVITKTDLPNLDVLTSGPMPPNPAELLSSPQMREIIATAKKSYDRVLIDGPPCLLISDALVLATQIDAVVLVARAANSSKGALRRAREQLSRVNARVIGAILNGVQARPGGYFREQYREFYEYMEEDVTPQELPPGPSADEIDIGDAPDRDDQR
jgi:succinoglycan biosynthesis transport protein ExoP